MSEENKNIQNNNQTENDSVDNQNSQNKEFQKIMSEIEIIKEKILNISFEQKTQFDNSVNEPKEIKKEFKLG